MARKKSNDTESTESVSGTELIINEVTNQFGEGVISSAQSLIDRPQKIISISPAIDYMLGGGITQGSWIGLSGKPKTGKTCLALNMAAKAQQAGMKVFYLNAEGRVKPRDLQGVEGLDIEKVNVIASTEEQILTAEAFLGIADKIVRTEREAFIIIDSISVLTEEARMSEWNKATRGTQARVISDFCSRNATVLPIKNSIIVGITHRIANLSGMGAASVEKSPNAWIYMCDIRLQTTYGEAWQDGQDDDQIGVITHWTCNCSSLRAPGRKVKSYVRFGIGIDHIVENINFALDFGIVGKKASWLSLELEGCEPIKVQGTEKLRAALLEQPAIYGKLVQELKTYGI